MNQECEGDFWLRLTIRPQGRSLATVNHPAMREQMGYGFPALRVTAILLCPAGEYESFATFCARLNVPLIRLRIKCLDEFF